jgi:hypothetical protein
MSWRCPACQTLIALNPGEDDPRLGVVYRCDVCRLELTYKTRGGPLIVARIEERVTKDRRSERGGGRRKTDRSRQARARAAEVVLSLVKPRKRRA